MTKKQILKEKLTAAFKLIRKKGIIARQNFSCCGGCGSSEMGTLMKEEKNKKRVIGYCFYHRQDAERMDGGSVYLAYGSNQTGDSVEVGKTILLACLEVGLNVTWNGSDSTRIFVEGVGGES